MPHPDKITMLRTQFSHLITRLTQWKVVFANWQLGTRDPTDGTLLAIQDFREADIRTNVKLDALIQLLTERGIISEEGMLTEQIEVANNLEKSLENKFQGAKATDDGMDYNDTVFQHTKDRLGFPV